MHKNNFDFLRLLFSIFVIVSHSYLLAGVKGDFLIKITAGQISFSDIGLAGFFSISGFLIYQSLIKSETLLGYLKKRFARIYPAFICAIIVTIITGWIVSDLSFKNYFSNRTPYNYLFKNISLFRGAAYNINGVFINNKYPMQVNGSLWTIPYEFFFYLLLAPMFFIRKRKLRDALIILSIVTLLVARFSLPGSGITSKFLNYFLSFIGTLQFGPFLHFLLFFIAGSVLFVFRSTVLKFKYFLFVAGLILISYSIHTHTLTYGMYILLPVTIVSFGLINTPYIAGLSKKIGDLSYGVYLYAYLIQQTLMHYFIMDSLHLMATTIPIALVAGTLSWNLVEKHFLSHKAQPALQIKQRRSLSSLLNQLVSAVHGTF